MRLFRSLICSATLLGVAVAQKPAPASLPIPGVDTVMDVPNAKQTPDPNLTYRIVFTVTKAAEKPTDRNPTLESIATEVNTLAKYGVPASHRKFVAVIYHDATDIILNDDAYKARHKGQPNPDIALMQQLTKAGVELKVCGQAVIYKKIDPKTIQPDVELDLVAWSTIMNFTAQGYTLFKD
jgi:intracellular sulfur oxidation DsrE/DsrF family protein